VPKESLGDNVEFDKEAQRLTVGKSGRSYSVGDRLKVFVESADPARRRITLALQSGTTTKPASGKWLTPDDLNPASAPAPKKPLPAKRKPGRGSPPPQKPRHGQKRGRGR
jgi:hypothetical protein